MVVEFSRRFVKELKKYVSKQEAKTLVRKLAKTSPAEGDFVASVATIVIREKRLKSFRFYFIGEGTYKHVVTADELREMIIKFVAMSKKNDQQAVIDRLKEDLQRFGFEL